MKSVHWPLMGGLLQLVQREGDWAGPQPTQTPLCYNKCNSRPINGQCIDHRCSAVSMHPLNGQIHVQSECTNTDVTYLFSCCLSIDIYCSLERSVISTRECVGCSDRRRAIGSAWGVTVMFMSDFYLRAAVSVVFYLAVLFRNVLPYCHYRHV